MTARLYLMLHKYKKHLLMPLFSREIEQDLEGIEGKIDKKEIEDTEISANNLLLEGENLHVSTLLYSKLTHPTYFNFRIGYHWAIDQKKSVSDTVLLLFFSIPS